MSVCLNCSHGLSLTHNQTVCAPQIQESVCLTPTETRLFIRDWDRGKGDERVKARLQSLFVPQRQADSAQAPASIRQCLCLSFSHVIVSPAVNVCASTAIQLSVYLIYSRALCLSCDQHVCVPTPVITMTVLQMLTDCVGSNWIEFVSRL